MTPMRTVQMTLDEDLVHKVDQVARQLKTTRSEFTRMALQEALEKYAIARKEREHCAGYEKQPVVPDEFSVWKAEQDWGDG